MKALLRAGLLCSLMMGSLGSLFAQPQVPVTPLKSNDLPAAIVGSDTIKMSEVQAIVDSKVQLYPLPKDFEKEARKAALDMLIDDALMRQFLRKTTQPPSPAEVQKDIDKLTEALKKNGQSLDQFLRDGKQTMDQLRLDIVARHQWKSYLISRYNEQDLHSYYVANKLFFDKVLVQASHILKKVNGNATQLDRQNAVQYLEKVRNDIQQGVISFENAALKYSECPSKEKGGDIGKFPYKFVVVKSFADAAFSLKTGQVSQVVNSEFGYHLIKVTNRKPGENSVFEEVKDTVREVKAQEEDLYQSILTLQRRETKIETFLR